VQDAVADDVGPAAQPLGVGVQLAAQVSQVGAADVARLAVLEGVPDARVGQVEVRRVAGQNGRATYGSDEERFSLGQSTA
jgi:hypothetical protein